MINQIQVIDTNFLYEIGRTTYRNETTRKEYMFRHVTESKVTDSQDCLWK